MEMVFIRLWKWQQSAHLKIDGDPGIDKVAEKLTLLLEQPL
jgi:hypothetical protein